MHEEIHPVDQWLEERRLSGRPLRKYQLAKEAGCSPSRLTQVLRDREMPSASLARRLKDITDISTDAILAAARPKPRRDTAA
jgi:transcriptional regulator with XRE-family HTH domain